MILLIDNFDSFAHNLARYLIRLGQAVQVARNDQLGVADVRRLDPAAIVLSPGPGTPREAGCSLELVRARVQCTPILGVCLGHQVIAAALGGRVVRAGRPVHGRASSITHTGRGIFRGVPNPLSVGRYHSLVVDRVSLPAELEVTAQTPHGTVMAIQHRRAPVVGLQFHPESVLTDAGYPLLANFLQLAGLPVVDPLPSPECELAR